MKAILIDDEDLALQYLEYQLGLIGEIEVTGKFTDPLEGKKAVESLDIDIVFLDIQIPEINGLELAEILLEEKPHLQIVFVTAYDEYAIKAFELNALDYLLKPIQLERLKITIQRTGQRNPGANHLSSRSKEWRIRMFGAFMILDENNQGFQKLNWRTGKAQELFFYLMHNRGKKVGKDKLIDLLWQGYDLARAPSHLYTTIYHIRKTLEPFRDRIRLKNTTDGYLLEIKDIRVDVDEFERFLHMDLPLEKETVSDYERLLILFQGEYLEDVDYVWADYDKHRYQLQWIRLKLNLVKWLYERKEYEIAYKHCDNICSRYPLEEEAHFMYMKICDQLGHHFLVRKQYQLIELLMRNEFHEEPSHEISQWYERWKKENLRD